MIASGLWNRTLSRLRVLPRDEGGQVLPMVCVVMVGMLGMAALAVDVGHAVYTSRELQGTTDAAALAAARAVPTAATAAAITGTTGVAAVYSAAPGGYNARNSLPNVTVTSTLECLATLKAQGIACVGAVPYNAVQVHQAMSLPTFFAKVVGVKTIALSATSTASTRGGAPRPSSIAIIMDTTLSMNQADTNCTANGVTQTQMQCALNGFQVLLQNLAPCGNYQTTCTNSQGVNQNPFDQVALFTFPGVTPSTASIDISCTTPIPSSYTNYPPLGYIVMPPSTPFWGVPTASVYTFPTAGATSYAAGSTTTYQLTSFLSDYKVSNAATSLNPNSSLVKAAGGKSNCGSMLPSNYDGVYGTYYASAIYAAQAALTAQQLANSGSENVIILLSDGDATAPQSANEYNSNYQIVNMPVLPSPANASGFYPSYVGECGQAITAAKAAAAAGTLFYTVAYGANPIGCASDVGAGQYPNISPCDTMYDMASAPQNFYSDWQQSGSNSICYSSQPVTALSDIFQAIANDLTEARLIPNNTT